MSCDKNERVKERQKDESVWLVVRYFDVMLCCWQVYYRIHASVIKFLLKREAAKDSIPFDSLEKSISRAASQPFVSCVEKDRRVDKRLDV